MTNILEQYREKKRQEQIEKTGINGYCSCCGAPNYIKTGMKHNEECIWYEDSLWWGRPGFDWAKSNGMDNSTQIVVKSKKPINANDEVFALAA